jgi:hypothetical protein
MTMSPPTATLTQRWRSRRDSYRPAGEVIKTVDYEVAAIDEPTAKSFVLKHHYSGSFVAARWRFGLYHHRHGLAGVAVFSHPVRDAVLTNVFPGDPMESVELGRLVLLDFVPANGESWLLGRCFEALRCESLVGVIAFSDPVPRRTSEGVLVKPGHVGTVYQAFNGAFLGRATARTLHVLPGGVVLSGRALQKIRRGETGWRYSVEQLVQAGAPAPGCLAGNVPDPDEPIYHANLAAHVAAFLLSVTVAICSFAVSYGPVTLRSSHLCVATSDHES